MNGDAKRIGFASGGGSIRTSVYTAAIGPRAHPAVCAGGDGDKSEDGGKGDGGGREDGGEGVGTVVPET